MSFPFFLSLCAFSFLLLGTFATGILYKFQWKKLFKSSLFIKIIFWIPLWCVYLSAYFLGLYGRWFFLLVLCTLAAYDAFRFSKKSPQKRFASSLYVFGFVAGILCLGIFIEQTGAPEIYFLSILATCAVSDVFAFFFGNALGKHSLPAYINKNKKVEGVLGQVIGGILGICIAMASGATEPSLFLGFLIGIGCAGGDIVNSFVKRVLAIKEWSNMIPGHGGVGDRFASLSGTGIILLLFYIII